MEPPSAWEHAWIGGTMVLSMVVVAGLAELVSWWAA